MTSTSLAKEYNDLLSELHQAYVEFHSRALDIAKSWEESHVNLPRRCPVQQELSTITLGGQDGEHITNFSNDRAREWSADEALVAARLKGFLRPIVPLLVKIRPESNLDHVAQELLQLVPEASSSPLHASYTSMANVNKTLAGILEGPSRAELERLGHYKIIISDLPNLNWDDLRTRSLPRDQLRYIKYGRSSVDGFVHTQASRADNTEETFPDFRGVGPPTDTPPIDIESVFQSHVDYPISQRVVYYVGPPLQHTSASSLENFLDPGHLLRDIQPIPGINTMYWHAGKQGSGTPLHIEDAHFYSANGVFAGEKLWMILPRSEKPKVEAMIEQEFGTSHCDQFVRHHSIIPSPQKLREAGITCQFVSCREGELILVDKLAYHAVLNRTDCFAMAINIGPPSPLLLPNDYRWCQRGGRRCGEYAVTYQDFRSQSLESELSLFGNTWANAEPNQEEQVSAQSDEESASSSDAVSDEGSIYERLSHKTPRRQAQLRPAGLVPVTEDYDSPPPSPNHEAEAAPESPLTTGIGEEDRDWETTSPKQHDLGDELRQNADNESILTNESVEVDRDGETNHAHLQLYPRGCEATHTCILYDLRHCNPNLQRLFQDTTMPPEDCARVLQLIMQCITPEASQTHLSRWGFEVPATSQLRSILEDIKERETKNHTLAFERRLMVVWFAQAVIIEQIKIQQEIVLARNRRRRQPEPGSQKTQRARRQALLKLLQVKELNDKAYREVSALVDEGSLLWYFQHTLGRHFLSCIPSRTIPSTALALKFDSASTHFKKLSSCIGPSQYETLSGKELEAFTRWLPELRPELLLYVSEQTCADETSLKRRCIDWNDAVHSTIVKRLKIAEGSDLDSSTVFSESL